MTFQQFFINDIIISYIIVFIIITFFLALIYYKKFLSLNKEYKDAKSIISSVIISFKRHQDEYDEKVNYIINDVEKFHSVTNSLTEKNSKIDGRINSLITSLKSAFIVNKTIVEQLTTIKEDINNLSKNQENIQKQIVSIEEVKETQKPVKLDISEEKKSSVILKETENQIIQFLLNEGSKTAPEVEKKIEKTREHTARLMKKLWQEGYIERDTHKIPFIYRINEKFKEHLEAKI